MLNRVNVAFTVVVPTCNRLDLLGRCLDCIAPGVQTLAAESYEVIVTDDGRLASAQEFIAQHYPWVRWIAGPGRGPAANRNYGVQHAQADWIVFTDDDCLPSRFWLQSFASSIRSDVHVYEGRTTCVAGIRSPMEHAPINEAGGLLWSCNMMIARRTFELLGGFDERFPTPHMEDVDLRERLFVEGVPMRFVPEAIVDHPPRRLSGKRLASLAESEVYYMLKRGDGCCIAARIINAKVRARIRTLVSYSLGSETVEALKSLAVEMFLVVVHLPMWIRRYRVMLSESARCGPSVRELASNCEK